VAISRHDPEWKRVVFMALAGGVRMKQTRSALQGKTWMYHWIAAVPGHGFSISGTSKYDVARKAVHMMAKKEFLPDAAKARAPRSGANELRSSR